jgi:hypothetical protein
MIWRAVYAARLWGERRAITSVCVICPSKLNVSGRADSQVECHGPSNHAAQSGDCHGQHRAAWVAVNRETRNRRGDVPAAGLGKAGGPRINPKSSGSREPCGSLMKGILTTQGQPWRCSRCFELWTRH